MKRKQVVKRKSIRSRIQVLVLGLILCINLQDAPLRVTFFQAEAYCQYIGASLPTKAELETVYKTGLLRVTSTKEWVIDKNNDSTQGYIDWNAVSLQYTLPNDELSFRCVHRGPNGNVWI